LKSRPGSHDVVDEENSLSPNGSANAEGSVEIFSSLGEGQRRLGAGRSTARECSDERKAEASRQGPGDLLRLVVASREVAAPVQRYRHDRAEREALLP
jgi:hypothetical protein